MFKIFADDRVLWTPGDRDKKILSPTINLEVNKVGSASFKILPNHNYYDYLEKMKTIITIVQDNRTVFKGRVYSDAEDFRRVKTVQVEGLLGYFNDSIVRPYDYSGSPEDYLEFLIDQHNDQVESFQQFKLGRVTVEDSNDYITRASSDCPTTWSEITNKLIDLLGGYIVIRYEEDGNYIDYLSDYEDTSTQQISFAVNLLDLNLETKGETLSTCIIPYGKQDESTGKKLDITSVNAGQDYICDDEAVAKYGRIFEVVEWPDVTMDYNLLSKAQAYLSNKIKLTTKLEVKAIDLHLSDKEIEGFKLGDYVRVYSTPHGIDDRVLLTAYNMDLSNPADCTITLNVEKSSYVRNSIKNNANKVEAIKKELGDSVSQLVENNGNQIKETILVETQTYVNQEIDNSEGYSRELLQEYATVSELESVKNTVSTEINQNAEEVNLQFTTINERITNENSEIINHLDEISKYIRFKDGDILLGEVGNDLTTKISNGRISFLYNDSVEVAYITDQKLYITHAEILDHIVIGNFAFIPRANGNLSFKKI